MSFCIYKSTMQVNGLNACVEKGFKEYIAAEDADILVIQETKLQQDKTEKFDEILASMGYPHRFWSCSTAKKGYSGTAVFSKIEPLNVHYGLGASGAHNEEGRTITCEFDSFYLVNSYVPNSGMKLERLDWYVNITEMGYISVISIVVMFYYYWCIRQLWSSSIILYNNK